MFSDTPPTIIHKRMSFFSVLAISFTAVLITVILSVAGIGVYGLRIVDRRADGLVGLIGQMADKLPEIRDALPPAIVDAIDDERRPDYLSNLRVSVKLVNDEDRRHRSRAAVEVENKGDETVSLLTMRVVSLDKNGDPLNERQTWVASPIQMEGDWRGPLLPHETRRFSVRYFDADNVSCLTHEMTEIRVWRGYDPGQVNDSKGLAARSLSAMKIVSQD